MTSEQQSSPTGEAIVTLPPYAPPELTYLGTLAGLTQKTVGASDMTTMMGLDVGLIS